MMRRLIGLTLLAAGLLAGAAPAEDAGRGAKPTSDYDMVKGLMASRAKYQAMLEQLRAWYMANGDMERARWAEEELRLYHRIPKQAFRLDLDVPAKSLKAAENIPEANELYRRAMTYKDRGWGSDYIDNQRRAELLLQQLLSSYPQSDKIGDAAYQLGDV